MSPPLRILVVSQFFTPEMGAPASRFYDFGKLLIQRGHAVTVVTGFPNSPTGIVPASYRGMLSLREAVDGIETLRGWVYASPRLSEGTKSLGFASFVASACWQVLARRLRADVVIATSPPPTVGIPGLLASWRLRAPLVFDIRDIWPEAITASQRVTSSTLIRPLERLEASLYRRAAAVTVVTDGKRERLIEKGVAPGKIHVVPNGVDLARFVGCEALSAGELRALGLDPELALLLYAGIMNPPQGLDTLLDAISSLRSQVPALACGVQLALVGGGSERGRLERRVREESLGGLVRFVDVQPRERIPSLLKAAAAIIVPLRPRNDDHTIPSKLYEAFASGRPVLVSADGAPGKIVRESAAGIATAAGDAAALTNSMRSVLEQPDVANALGARGAAYAARFDRAESVDRLEELLRTLARPSPR